LEKDHFKASEIRKLYILAVIVSDFDRE